jgi:hypothetical protein
VSVSNLADTGRSRRHVRSAALDRSGSFGRGDLAQEFQPLRMGCRCGPFTPDERRSHDAAIVRRQWRRELEQRAGALYGP